MGAQFYLPIKPQPQWPVQWESRFTCLVEVEVLMRSPPANTNTGSTPMEGRHFEEPLQSCSPTQDRQRPWAPLPAQPPRLALQAACCSCLEPPRPAQCRLCPADIDECQEYGAALCGTQRCENTAGSYRCVAACQVGYQAGTSGDCVGECARRVPGRSGWQGLGQQKQATVDGQLETGPASDSCLGLYVAAATGIQECRWILPL